MASLYSKSKKT